MTDLRKAAQMALDWRDKNGELLFALGGWDFIFEINNWSQSLRGALAQPEPEEDGGCQACEGNHCTAKNGCVALDNPRAQPEPEPVATLFGSLPVYDVPSKQEPVAWRTFDGEGGYEYRSYEMNENYAEEWNKRNPNHKGWVEPLYTAPPQREWQELTDEEIENCFEMSMFGTCRAIEAKLKAKNGY